MLQSQLFTKITKELPRNEISFNAQTLIRAGFIDKVSAGVYTFLPLGLRVHDKICKIVREEMDKIGGQEILMPALTPKEVWQTTDRWDSFDVLFRLKGSDSKEYALGATHEEIVSPLVKKHVFSYRELPIYVYQIQTKFRNELRAKAGLIRGREFSMKDLYSFHASKEDLDEYYEKVKEAYFKIYKRLGLGDMTYLTFASGGAFSKYSHEFQTLTEAGEDTIYLCEKCQVAINEEIITEQKICPECQGSNLVPKKAVEVGNIFKLGTKFSKPFNLEYTDKNGEKKDVIMGCYGLGPSRVMGTIVEVHHDDQGIIWPKQIAPFLVHLVSLNQNKDAQAIYEELLDNNIEALFDDRNISIGEKFAEADLIGCPIRLVISEKTLKENSVEVKKRHSDKCVLIKRGDIISYLS